MAAIITVSDTMVYKTIGQIVVETLEKNMLNLENFLKST